MITISQSLIRDMLNEKGYCGHYLNEVYNNGFSPEPTDAMVNGLFFEQAILGSTRDGARVEIPKLKSGDKSKREQDLDLLIAWATRIIQANSIELKESQVSAKNQDRHGHIDAIGTYNGQPYLFDLKYTGMAYSQWDREFNWGQITGHFTLQARHYQSLMDKPMPFMFLVFGNGWARFFEIPYNEDDIIHHIEIAAEALETFNAMEYTPTTDSRLCFECRMKDHCKFVNNTIQIEQL